MSDTNPSPPADDAEEEGLGERLRLTEGDSGAMPGSQDLAAGEDLGPEADEENRPVAGG
jgi:hypothetical protein